MKKSLVVPMLLMVLLALAAWPSAERQAPAIELSGQVADETFNVVSVNRTLVDVTAIGDTELIAAQGEGKKVRVLALAISTGAAVAVRLKSAGNNLSASLALGLNDDFVFPYNPHGWFQTGANEALVMNSSIAAVTGVQIVWVVI